MLTSVRIQSLRNLTEWSFLPDARFNLISGPNGVGKTALLEALSLLSCGHSFRTREIAPLIQHDKPCLTLFSKLTDGQTMSIQKSHDSATHVKLNGQTCLKASELAQVLPAQVIYQDIFEIIDAGPAVRRRMLDWGMFHVKHDYHETWKDYRQALKQRNVLLRQGASQQLFAPWNQVLSDLAMQLHLSREAYTLALIPLFKEKLMALSHIDCSLIYEKGWGKSDTGLSLETVFQQSYEQDRLRKYTQYGPHHADLVLSIDRGKMRQYLSRGQQKIILIALKLAQAALLAKPCLFLWDDVSSELDHDHLGRLADLIQSTPGQFFITGIDIERTPLSVLSGKLVKMDVSRETI